MCKQCVDQQEMVKLDGASTVLGFNPQDNRAQYRSVRVIGRVREFRGDGFRAHAGARPASLGAGDLRVVIDGLPTTDYPHSRFRNPASSISIRACELTKPDAGSVVGPAELHHLRLTLLSLFSPNQKSPRIKRLKHSALCRNRLLIFRLALGNLCPRCSGGLTSTNLADG